MVAEPVALGLLVAPSVAGAALALAAFALLFLHQPLRVAWMAGRQGRRTPKTWAARGFAAFYGALGILGVAAALALAGWTPLIPLLFAGPFLVIYLLYDVQRRGRTWQAEIAGPVGLAAVAAGIGLAGGLPRPVAYALWALMVARAGPSILYIRARLRLERGERSSAWPALSTHVAATLVVAGLAWVGYLPLLAVVAILILLLRASLGLGRYRRRVTTKRIGVTEIVLGALVVALVSGGFALDL